MRYQYQADKDTCKNTYDTLLSMINKAKHNFHELDKLEKRIVRHYDNGTLTASQLRSLDYNVMRYKVFIIVKSEGN